MKFQFFDIYDNFQSKDGSMFLSIQKAKYGACFSHHFIINIKKYKVLKFVKFCFKTHFYKRVVFF